MLQQTQVARVVPKYEAWLRAFPDVESLASAKISDVLRLWSGLGYNRRALYLRKAAKTISEDCGGVFPQDTKALQSLPGVGEYTAGAVLCFAFNMQIAVVDTNIRKVISLRFFKGNPPSQKVLREYAERLLPKGKAYEWNQALMDYAATILSREKVTVKKQRRFHGSDRYYRGKILRFLLERGSVPYGEIRKIGEDNGDEWFRSLLRDLEKEGFLRTDGKSVRLA